MIPATLAHYRVLSSLGAGGMGEVYLAEDMKLGRKVALKVLAPGLAGDPERRARFEREARAVAALNHSSIVTLYSVEEHDGVLFLTMELVEGRTLADLIPRQGMSIEQLLAVAIPLADAVAAAHQRGITHRDLKAANVMLTDDGRVKVLDFGLAKLHEDVTLESEAAMTAASLTVDGRIIGTVAYMSPEQAQGKAVDARSDIFSLGILVYEMATGERPFKGDSHVSVLSAILKDSPRSVNDVRADLPRELGRILKRCLAKDAEDRYQTAKDLRSDLRLLKDETDSGEAVRAATGSDARSANPRAPRRGARWWYAGLAAGVLVVAVTAARWWSLAPPPSAIAHPFSSITMRRLTNTGNASLAAISPDGRYVVHVVGAVDRPSLWLRQVSSSSNVQIVAPMQGAYGGLAFSPDGERLLYLFYPPNTFGSLFQIPLLGGPPRRLVDDLDSVPTFSPDGGRMAFVRDMGKGVYDVVLADAHGAGQRPLASRPALDAFMAMRMAWSPDGATIAAFAGAFYRRRVVLIDVATGKERTLGPDRFDSPGQLAWLPDGRALVADAVEQGSGFGASGGQLWSISYPDGAVRRITSDVANYSSLGATRDGRALVAVQHDVRGSLWVAAEHETARARAITSHSAGRDGALGLDWTADGHIVYSATTHGNWDLWVSDPSGASARQLTSDPGTELMPCVLPDGRTIAFMTRAAGDEELHLRAIDVEGTHLRDLLPEPVQPMFLQAVGDDLFFRRQGGRMAVNPVIRLPIAGGPPGPILADTAKLPPNFVVRRISSDGQWVLGTTLDPKVPGATIAVLPISGGAPIRTFPYASSGFPPLAGGFGWAPGDRAVEALLLRDGAVNLWRFPMDGSPPRQITAFTSDQIVNFAWSRDAKMLAMSRVSESADVVLITQQP